MTARQIPIPTPLWFACRLLILALCCTTNAQELPKRDTFGRIPNLHQWGSLVLFHGLPSDHVRAIAQDHEGVLWFGTDAGLAHYDGHRIHKIAGDGLPAGRVRALKLDSDGVLWIGTDSGATRLINGSFYPIFETDGHAVTAIIAPSVGRAIIASQQGSIFDCTTRADGSVAVNSIHREDHPLLSVDLTGQSPLTLTSLALVSNTVLVGTRSRGLLAISDAEAREIFSRPRAFFVEAIEVDAEGRAWLGVQTSGKDSGLYQSSDLMRPQKIPAGTGTVTALKFDSRRNLWMGTDDQGAFLYRDSRTFEHFTFENTAGGLRSNHINAVFVDREGVVWFGTDRGVCRYDPHSLRIEAVAAHPDSNFARVLFQSRDGWLWCGTNRGLFVRTKAGGGWHEIRELAGKTVHAIAEDAPQHLLVGTAGGLYTGIKPTTRQRRARGAPGQFPGERFFSRLLPSDESTSYVDSVRDICEFQGSFYIASFGRGLERLERDRRILVWPAESAISLHSDRGKRLWIGTAGAGVSVFDGNEVTHEESLDRLSSNTVWSISGSGDGALWLATPLGLNAYRPGSELVRLLEGTDARRVVSSEPGAWCVTAGGGLYRVVLDDEAGPVVARLDTELGLPSQDAFAILSAVDSLGDEVLWIGTNRGVARYVPGRIPPRLTPLRVMSKRVFQPEEIRAGIDLDYPQNGLALDVEASSSRSFPEQFQYSFALFDGAGKRLKHKIARDSQFLIENLPAGRYRIETRAFTGDLMPSEPLVLNFLVARAPFPRTSTALAVLLAIALVAIWWGYRQNRRLAGTNVALGDANRQLAATRMQLASETETERRRIARDLHDQTLADLRRLLLLTDQLPAAGSKNGQQTIDPLIFRSEIETISTEIRRICEDLSPSTLANVGLAAALEWALGYAVAQMPLEQKFACQFICDEAFEERLCVGPVEQIQIYRIVQEALSNICRHSGATQVRLVLRSGPAAAWCIELEDNGKGFDEPANRPTTGRGLTNIRSRASLVDAEVKWTGRPGGGTVFTLKSGKIGD
jgi:signal transduction histidine kinase/ligand-binding sensor domain-containing protein